MRCHSWLFWEEFLPHTSEQFGEISSLASRVSRGCVETGRMFQMLHSLPDPASQPSTPADAALLLLLAGILRLLPRLLLGRVGRIRPPATPLPVGGAGGHRCQSSAACSRQPATERFAPAKIRHDAAIWAEKRCGDEGSEKATDFKKERQR